MSQQQKWIERAQAVLPAGGFGNFDPGVIIKQGKGSRVIDEDDNEYREDIMSLINDDNRYGHVSILDADKMVKNMVENAMESHLISKDMLNNYFVFDVEYLLQNWYSSFVDHHLVRRRSMCTDCIPLKKRLGNIQKIR